MKHVLVLALALAAFATVPVDVVEPAEACQPYTWYCPLTGDSYGMCGGLPVNSPLVQCAVDFVLRR